MLTKAPINVVLPAADLARAEKFYSEKLGLTGMERDEGGILISCGGDTKIYIYERPAVKVEHTQASFTVKDIEAEMKELRGRGVVFEEYDMPGLKTVNGIAELGGMKSAWFKDSEGNIIAIAEYSK